MITLEQARKAFEKMVDDSERGYKIFEVWEVNFSEPIFVMTVIDEEGNQYFPGEVFKSIRKKDGSLVDFRFPSPA